MLKAYKYRIYPNNEQKTQKQRHLAVAVLRIIRHWHTGNFLRNMQVIRNLRANTIIISHIQQIELFLPNP